MKRGPYVLVILALGGWSTNVAVAAHHGHRAGATTSAQASSHSSPTPTAGQQGSGLVTDGGAADHANADKGAIDRSGPHAKTPPLSASSPDIGPAAANGHDINGHDKGHTGAPNGGTRDSGTGAAIDTSITVHQGREIAKNRKVLTELTKLRERLFKAAKTAIAPASDPAHQGAGKHQKSFADTRRGRQRNAIGVTLDRSPAASAANPAPPGANTATKATPPTNAPAAVGTNQETKPGGGTTPTDKANTPGIDGSRHGPGTGVVGAVSAGGSNINGTGMGHPWMGTGAIGGPAKIAGSFISGNSIRPRHP